MSIFISVSCHLCRSQVSPPWFGERFGSGCHGPGRVRTGPGRRSRAYGAPATAFRTELDPLNVCRPLRGRAAKAAGMLSRRFHSSASFRAPSVGSTASSLCSGSVAGQGAASSGRVKPGPRRRSRASRPPDAAFRTALDAANPGCLVMSARVAAKASLGRGAGLVASSGYRRPRTLPRACNALLCRAGPVYDPASSVRFSSPNRSVQLNPAPTIGPTARCTVARRFTLLSCPQPSGS
jgi:hypothetical protein